ncbi:hypothetical protein D9613_010243 [Agrocybe pediades]|uniref:Methyltransferase n=1 Tax=Agrocybe pediades TaxID=84607 RepID=A0A8H4VHX6_9AGAR|nr:hypothetical protein D9613_010243 [Agrocybe pediades]
MPRNGPKVTTGSVNFLAPPADPKETLFHYTNVELANGKDMKNYELARHTVQIENLRGKEQSVSLDTTGFQYFRLAASHKSFATDEEIKEEYYPESIELIKKLTGATKVVIFDHTIRRRDPGVADTSETRQPAAVVHGDQTTISSVARVHRHLPEPEAIEALKRRFQIINLWRPIAVPAYDWPLALCDYRSVKREQDTVPIKLIYPDFEGELLGVKYSPDYKWKYLDGMTPEEGVLIKCFDSIQDGSVAIFTPHTAFEDPATPQDAPYRRSIELRALVFYN